MEIGPTDSETQLGMSIILRKTSQLSILSTYAWKYNGIRYLRLFLAHKSS